MTLSYPGERGVKNGIKAITQDELVFSIRRRYEPKQVHGGLLWYARLRHWKDGWAAYAFKEIYGAWPRDDQKGEPICILDTDLEQWCWARKRKAVRGATTTDSRPSKYNSDGDTRQNSALMSADDRDVDL
jgi:hypothetical protein